MIQTLPKCVVCESAFMADSKDGVTCGNASCAQKAEARILQLIETEKKLTNLTKGVERVLRNFSVNLPSGTSPEAGVNILRDRMEKISTELTEIMTS